MMISKNKKTHFGFKEVEENDKAQNGARSFFISRFKI